MLTRRPIARVRQIAHLRRALLRAPVVALLGQRQCGKTTLARQVAADQPGAYFDLESPADLRQLENPEYVLGRAVGLVVIDESAARLRREQTRG